MITMYEWNEYWINFKIYTLKVVNLSEGLASMIITLIYKLLSIKLENVNVKCRAILFFKAIAL